MSGFIVSAPGPSAERGRQAFIEQGYESRGQYPVGGAVLQVFIRSLRTHALHDASDGTRWLALGSLAYRGAPMANGLERIAKDHCTTGLHDSDFVGHFHLLRFSDDAIEVGRDPGGLLGLYGDEGRTVVSSSLLALRAAVDETVGWDRAALEDNLLTGCFFGASTPWRRLRRIAPEDLRDGPLPIRALLVSERSLEVERPATLGRAVDAQISALDGYFEAVSGLIGRDGPYMGISGGYDSRLLYAMAKRHGLPVRAFGHSKPNTDPEIRIASELVKHYDEELVTVPVTPPPEMDAEHLEANLDQSMLSCDGQVRVNLGWMVDYRQLWYRREVAGGARAGLDGIGGERYRNAEKFVLGRQRFRSWLQHGVVEPGILEHVPTSRQRRPLERLSAMVRDRLNLEARTIITLADAKRYQDELWIAGGPAVRIHLGHHVGHYLMPFADPTVAATAMAAIPYLRGRHSLQIAMLEALSPALAAVVSNYGHPLNRVPRSAFARGIIRGLIPATAKVLYRRTRGDGAVGSRLTAMAQRPCIAQCLEAFGDLDLAVPPTRVVRHERLFDRAVAIGHLVRRA